MKVTGSNITITDSVVNKMDILPLGNAEQDTYTGKNKLNNTVTTTTTTSGGITCTPNNDGSFTLNGTSTATVFFRLSQTQDFGTTDFSSINNISDSYKSILINGTNVVTLNYTHANLVTAIRIASGTTLNNLKVYPMILLKTETNETFEKYVRWNTKS